jgi:peroxiredoxin Q/BCP
MTCATTLSSAATHPNGRYRAVAPPANRTGPVDEAQLGIRLLGRARSNRIVTQPVPCDDAPMLGTGTKAPDFTLPDEDGDDVSLASLAGSTVVLYFYPKADTPGCTTQACGIRDHLPDYAEAGVRVLGVSPDPVKAVKKFHDKQALNFTLLADEDHAVCDAYGVWAEKSMYGRTFWGAQRTTFIIDENGVVAHVIKKAKPETHDEEVLAALRELSAAA